MKTSFIDAARHLWKVHFEIPKRTGRELDFTDGKKSWGHNLVSRELVDVGTMTAFCITPDPPKPGDEILQSMQSGEIAIWRVIEAKHVENPNDMTAIKCLITGYKKE
jgi:hypothetical protein